MERERKAGFTLHTKCNATQYSVKSVSSPHVQWTTVKHWLDHIRLPSSLLLRVRLHFHTLCHLYDFANVYPHEQLTKLCPIAHLMATFTFVWQKNRNWFYSLLCILFCPCIVLLRKTASVNGLALHCVG